MGPQVQPPSLINTFLQNKNIRSNSLRVNILELFPQLLIVFIFLYIYTSIGVYLFVDIDFPDPFARYSHFQDYGSALQLLFILSTGDRWTEVSEWLIHNPQFSSNHFKFSAYCYIVSFMLIIR